jgi:hypothetical protein
VNTDAFVRDIDGVMNDKTGAESMNLLSDEDRSFGRLFDAGDLSPAGFDHKAHLRLAYVHLATHGIDKAAVTFRESLQQYLRHHQIDPAKFHETLTQAWLQAVWYFMRRSGGTSGSDEFLARSQALHDPGIMLTHYSKEVMFSEEARRQFVMPNLDPIPCADGRAHGA